MESQCRLGDKIIELLGPAGFERVDWLDQDINIILAAFQPESCLTLAIYAEPAAWEKFYAEVYGRNPKDLAYFASISTPAMFLDENLSGPAPDVIRQIFSSVRRLSEEEAARSVRRGSAALLEAGTLALAPFDLIEGRENYVSFETRLGTVQKNEEDEELFREHYRLIVSAVLVQGKMVLLNLYSNRHNEPPEEARRLALAWRDAYLAKAGLEISK